MNNLNFVNIKDLILKSIHKTWKKDNIVKSIIWNEVVYLFKNKKNIDIQSFLISIKLSWDVIIIKTLKPILNQEIKMYKNEIIENIKTKLSNIWIVLNINDIKTK